MLVTGHSLFSLLTISLCDRHYCRAAGIGAAFCFNNFDLMVSFCTLNQYHSLSMLPQVSLDTMRADRFAAITRRNGFDAVLSALKASLQHGYGGR